MNSNAISPTNLFSQFEKIRKSNSNIENEKILDFTKFYSEIQVSENRNEIKAILLIERYLESPELYILKESLNNELEVQKSRLFFDEDRLFMINDCKSPIIYHLLAQSLFIYDNYKLYIFKMKTNKKMTFDDFILKSEKMLNDWVQNPILLYLPIPNKDTKLLIVIGGYDADKKPINTISLYEIPQDEGKILLKGIISPSINLQNSVNFIEEEKLFLLEIESQKAESFDLTEIIKGGFFPCLKLRKYECEDRGLALEYKGAIEVGEKKFLAFKNMEKLALIKINKATRRIQLKDSQLRKPTLPKILVNSNITENNKKLFILSEEYKAEKKYLSFFELKGSN